MRFLIVSILCFLFIGCSSKIPVIETKEVYIPTKCKVVVPSRPKQTNVIDKDVINVLEYTEHLEIIIDKCVDKE